MPEVREFAHSSASASLCRVSRQVGRRAQAEIGTVIKARTRLIELDSTTVRCRLSCGRRRRARRTSPSWQRRCDGHRPRGGRNARERASCWWATGAGATLIPEEAGTRCAGVPEGLAYRWVGWLSIPLLRTAKDWSMSASGTRAANVSEHSVTGVCAHNPWVVGSSPTRPTTQSRSSGGMFAPVRTTSIRRFIRSTRRTRTAVASPQRIRCRPARARTVRSRCTPPPAAPPGCGCLLLHHSGRPCGQTVCRVGPGRVLSAGCCARRRRRAQSGWRRCRGGRRP